MGMGLAAGTSTGRAPSERVPARISPRVCPAPPPHFCALLAAEFLTDVQKQTPASGSLQEFIGKSMSEVQLAKLVLLLPRIHAVHRSLTLSHRPKDCFVPPRQHAHLRPRSSPTALIHRATAESHPRRACS